jgi:hypothetical protein
MENRWPIIWLFSVQVWCHPNSHNHHQLTHICYTCGNPDNVVPLSTSWASYWRRKGKQLWIRRHTKIKRIWSKKGNRPGHQTNWVITSVNDIYSVAWECTIISGRTIDYLLNLANITCYIMCGITSHIYVGASGIWFHHSNNVIIYIQSPQKCLKNRATNLAVVNLKIHQLKITLNRTFS